MKYLEKFEKIFESNNNTREFFDLLCYEAECEEYHYGSRDKSGRIDLIHKYIFEKNVDINSITLRDGHNYNYSPLTRMISLCDYPHYCYAEKIALFLIDIGADVNIAPMYKITPLMSATNLGNKEIVKKLIKNGARLDDQDLHGDTAFIRGINDSNGIQNTIEELIKAGADWFIANEKGEYPWKLLSKFTYYMKHISKLYPEQYNNALMIANAKNFNI